MAAIRRGHGRVAECSDIVLGQSKKSIPEELNKIYNSRYSKTTAPAIQFNNAPKLIDHLPDESTPMDSRDLVWLISRDYCANTQEQLVPGWTAFNHKVCKVTPAITTVGYMPILPAPTTEYDTVWTVILQCQEITKHLRQKYTVLTFDEGIYYKGKQLAWANPGQWQDLVLRLGSFHIAMQFLKVIGDHFQDSGLSDVLIESGMYGETTVTSILHRKQWNRAVRCHKLAFEALGRLYWQTFLKWLAEDQISFDMFNENSDRIIAALRENDKDELLSTVNEQMTRVNDLKPHLDDFVRLTEDNPTFAFWKQYMMLVQLLLLFFPR